MPQQEAHDTLTTTPVRDAREVLSAKKEIETSTKSSFPKITFTDTNTSVDTMVTPKDTMKTTQTLEPQNTTTTTQTLDRSKDSAEISRTTTQTPDSSKDTAEACVSRVDPNICIQEELTHYVEPPTIGPSTRLEASHEMITEGLVATV